LATGGVWVNVTCVDAVLADVLEVGALTLPAVAARAAMSPVVNETRFETALMDVIGGRVVWKVLVSLGKESGAINSINDSRTAIFSVTCRFPRGWPAFRRRTGAEPCLARRLAEYPSLVA
jgi:hypothetical protein